MGRSITPDAWREQGRRIALDGRQLFVIDDGLHGSPVILLLHGFPTSSWDWAPIWTTLGRDHRLVAFDYLGFGFGYSDKPRGHRYSVMEQADFAEALVRELGLGSFHVLAHDLGDTVAQELLARQNAGLGAGRWQSLCLLNGGLFPETHRPLLVQKLLLGPLGPLASRLLSRRAFESAMRRIFGPDTPPSAAELDGFWELLAHDDGVRNFHRLIRYMDERRQHRERWVGALQQACVPLGLINGSVDPISGAHMVQRYRELVRNDDFILELPTIGHYPQVEAPQVVEDGYRRFLATAGVPA